MASPAFKIPEPKRTGCYKTSDNATFDDPCLAKQHEVIIAMRKAIINLLPNTVGGVPRTLSPHEMAEMILKKSDHFYPIIQAYRRLSCKNSQ